MVKRLVSHDDVTGACELTELNPYPDVTSNDASATIVATTAADGKVSYDIAVPAGAGPSVVTNTQAAGNRIATHTSSTGVITQIRETNTTIADNADSTFTYTNEAGVAVTIGVCDLIGDLTVSAVKFGG